MEAYIDGQGILRVRSKIDAGEDEVELDVTADRYFAIVKGNEEQDIEFQDVPSDIKAVSKTSPTPFRPGNHCLTCLSYNVQKKGEIKKSIFHWKKNIS